MTEDSPYQTPQFSSVQATPLPDQRESGALQAFGVLHIVFGVVGIIFGLWSAASIFFSSRMSGIGMPQGPQRDAIVEVQKKYLVEVGWVSVMSGIFMLILAAMLLVSGPKLWKKQKAGLVWSNRYAWTSIATKIISIVIGVLVVMPASREMMDVIAKGMPGKSETTASIMSISSAAGVVLGPFVAMVYPALALILLNRSSVKNFLQ